MRKKICLVLGSGGARGVAHIGDSLFLDIHSGEGNFVHICISFHMNEGIVPQNRKKRIARL
jgi:hypothetical protein